MGKVMTDTSALQCSPVITNEQMNVTVSVDGTPLLPNANAYPCGLIAKSVFTDNFTLSTSAFDANTPNLNIVQFDETNIAWKSDQEKFKNQAGNWGATQWIDVENQHFIVWMRVAGLPSFRKLYAAINTDLDATTYYLKISNTYDVSGWDGTKTFVLSTSNNLGGQNYFLGVAFIIVGSLCMTLSIIFFGVFMSKKNSTAQMSLQEQAQAEQTRQ